jgi:hypothetical protein
VRFAFTPDVPCRSSDLTRASATGVSVPECQGGSEHKAGILEFPTKRHAGKRPLRMAVNAWQSKNPWSDVSDQGRTIKQIKSLYSSMDSTSVTNLPASLLR